MKNLLPYDPGKKGMVIVEVLCALLIFGMASVALMKALTVSAQSATISQLELRMILRLQSRLTETSKYPKIDELYSTEPVKTTDPDELGVWTRTEIIKLDNLQNQDGQPLNDMYQIVVTAFYDDFGRTGQMSADTVRYAKLFSTTGAAGAAPTIPQTR